MDRRHDCLFTNALFDSGALNDIAVSNGRIAAISPAGEIPRPAAATVDLGGALVVPGFVEGHIHLDTSFYGDRTAALALVGHWAYPNHNRGLGENAILIPMPKFGDRHVTGLGSWNWGISADSKHPAETAAFLAFLMRPEEVVRISNANGAVPGRKAAIPLSPLYREGGRLNLYYKQLLTIGVSRPFHPAYPSITRAFADAVSNVASGADVKTELHKAATRIDRGIAENGGYPPFGGKK